MHVKDIMYCSETSLPLSGSALVNLSRSESSSCPRERFKKNSIIKTNIQILPLLPHLEHGPVIRSPQNRFSQHWRLSENFSSTRQKIATRSMFCKVQDKVLLPLLAVILVRPLPGFKNPNTTSGSTAAFTTDCMQSLATFKTVPRKQVGRPATLAELR